MKTDFLIKAWVSESLFNGWSLPQFLAYASSPYLYFSIPSSYSVGYIHVGLERPLEKIWRKNKKSYLLAEP